MKIHSTFQALDGMELANSIIKGNVRKFRDKLRLKEAFYDEDKDIRKTVSSVMSMIMVRGGFNAWPGLLQFLTDNLQVANL